MSGRGRLLFVLFLLATGPAMAQSGGNGTIYYGTYAKTVLVVEERTMRVTETIPVSVGIPTIMFLSEDRKRLYVSDPGFEHFEVIDIASRQQVDRFTLSEGATRVRVSGMSVDPRERFAVLLIKTYTKQADRFEIGKPTLVKYDLREKRVTDTIPWPKDEEREGARILFSPSGELMYFFAEDILIYDTSTLKQVDRWQLATALDQGMGRFNFGFPRDFYEEPGFYSGLFRVTDPVQRRTLMGVARVDLSNKTVDFYTLGPSAPVGFAMTPDRKRAYGLRSEVGNYEFWVFDLEGRRVAGRTPFAGRPRMRLLVSSNGRYLYIAGAGSTIDIYDARTFQLVRTVDMGADVTGMIHVPPAR
jgi:DNA-binding beta-propeller fold protein YncE